MKEPTELQMIMALMIAASNRDDMGLTCMPAIDNETGEDAVLFGAVMLEGDDEGEFIPIGVCFSVDELPDRYTVDFDDIQFSDDYAETPEDLGESGEFETDENKSWLSVFSAFSGLTRRFSSCIMWLRGKNNGSPT